MRDAEVQVGMGELARTSPHANARRSPAQVASAYLKVCECRWDRCELVVLFEVERSSSLTTVLVCRLRIVGARGALPSTPNLSGLRAAAGAVRTLWLRRTGTAMAPTGPTPNAVRASAPAPYRKVEKH